MSETESNAQKEAGEDVSEDPPEVPEPAAETNAAPASEPSGVKVQEPKPERDTEKQSESVGDEGEVASGTNADSSDAVKYIKVRVVTSHERDGIHFRLKMTTPLIKLKKSYYQHKGITTDCLRFFFDGTRIMDDDTPKKLEMVDDDQIEVYQDQLGGF